MPRYVLRASFSDDELIPIEVARAIATWPAFHSRPRSVSVDTNDSVPFDEWPELLQNTEIKLFADWCSEENEYRGDESYFVSCSVIPPSLTIVQAPRCVDHPQEVLQLIETLPFGIGAFGPPYYQKPDFMKKKYGFGGGHADFGWGCAFKGAGHDRFISRRWLEHGPWVVWHGKNDTTMLQFHPLDADPDSVERIALPGWVAATANADGGLLGRKLSVHHEIKGVYDAATQTLRVIAAHGRTVSTAEMRDACSVRHFRRDDPGQPIRQIAYVFVHPADARTHLHDLWLRELECWTFSPDGTEVRLDVDYNPPRVLPEWAR